MTEFASLFEDLVAAFLRDPIFARVQENVGGVLIWNDEASRILYASPEALGLKKALEVAHGTSLTDLASWSRLKALAGGLAPREGGRLERLRLDPAGLAPPLTCICRLASVKSKTVLVTAILGETPKVRETKISAPEKDESARGFVRQGSVRFVWQMDANFVFTAVSKELANIVGEMAADILGYDWHAVAGSMVGDEGAVGSRLLTLETFSGVRVQWKVDNTKLEIPVDLAGAPVFGSRRELLGFRGFGLLRTDEAQEREAVVSFSENVPEEPAQLEILDDSAAADESWFESIRDLVSQSLSQTKEGEAQNPSPANGLSSTERSAFREIAKALGARFEKDEIGESGKDKSGEDQKETSPASPANDDVQWSEVDEARDERIRQLEAILDTATDGVIVCDEEGQILSLNRSAEALFGYDQGDVLGERLTLLFAPESHQSVLDYLAGLRAAGVARLLNDGREVLGRVRQGDAIPLFMTMGPVKEGPGGSFCAVLRDITAFKQAEAELTGARRVAEEANAQKSDVLAKISHEIRTPLNAIIGFAEVMMEERFGPIGNERYKDYLRDVHASGAHVISLVNDLLDLAKIEAGRLDLALTNVSLNALIGTCVTLLQPQAARDRVVMRTSFARDLPAIVADERSIRQIALNLISNAIKFTDAGGQVIVSTAVTDRGEIALRIRDTGIGMTEKEVESALEPFRQLATTRRRGGTGLGLPLTKALVEANRGDLRLTSHPNEGTLAEILFPPLRVSAR